MIRDVIVLGPAPQPETEGGARKFPTLKPRDAASLILIDRSRGTPRVLVGKRGRGHAFMPDLYVFPGGRRDASDSRASISAPLDGSVLERLAARTSARFTPGRAIGLAVAAARELEEEVCLSLTPPDCGGGFRPDLSRLRYVARAITPPGQNRRFDTRFFACFTDEVGVDAAAARSSAELQDPTWIDIGENSPVQLPRITHVILRELSTALAEDRTLPFGRTVPFYYVHRGRFVRETI